MLTKIFLFSKLLFNVFFICFFFKSLYNFVYTCSVFFVNFLLLSILCFVLYKRGAGCLKGNSRFIVIQVKHKKIVLVGEPVALLVRSPISQGRQTAAKKYKRFETIFDLFSLSFSATNLKSYRHTSLRDLKAPIV